MIPTNNRAADLCDRAIAAATVDGDVHAVLQSAEAGAREGAFRTSVHVVRSNPEALALRLRRYGFSTRANGDIVTVSWHPDIPA